MSQIAEELSFAVLCVTKLRNSWCSCYFLEVSQEAKVAPSFSAGPLCPTTKFFWPHGVSPCGIFGTPHVAKQHCSAAQRPS